jgi:hypothetical protein
VGRRAAAAAAAAASGQGELQQAAREAGDVCGLPPPLLQQLVQCPKVVPLHADGDGAEAAVRQLHALQHGRRRAVQAVAGPGGCQARDAVLDGGLVGQQQG